MGVDADTGRVLDALDDSAVQRLQAERGLQRGIDSDTLASRAEEGGDSFGCIGDVDPEDLAQAGWGVIWGPSAGAEHRKALSRLIEWRRAMCGEGLFVEYEGETGYTGKTAEDWLKARGARMDVVDPEMGVPYYILIVAPPHEIPFEFQYSLDMYWAVGRLWFPTIEEFRQYAESVVDYESAENPPLSRNALVFSPKNDFDRATELLCEHVAEPFTAGRTPLGHRQGFGTKSLIGDAATRQNLLSALRGKIEGGTPSLLFLGGHGKSFRCGDTRQDGLQGALICQDWPGAGRTAPEMCLTAADVDGDSKLHGTIVVLFACYGGGWPTHDQYARTDPSAAPIAERPSLARLPQALLGAGTLAVLAHIDRAWTNSFLTGGRAQNQGFRDVMGRVMRGDRLGHTTDQFNFRWAVLSAQLSETLDAIRKGAEPNLKRLGHQWLARDDARNYVLLGDPAVKLRTKREA